MKTKHTPGPWYRDEDGFISSWVEGITVADPQCSNADIDEREANANLIAAAPDLLQALHYVTQCLEDWVEVADPDYDVERDREAIAAAHAATQKATGEVE